ncbi:MAG: hypothetical protein WBE76_05425 [Terracidiphilus sp.]
MSNHTLDAVLIAPNCGYAPNKLKATLTANIDELAGLRFSILITARWEESEDETEEQRAQLRSELDLLRSLYFDKIDQIAMAFGVRSAMRAQQEVERTVILPRSGKPAGTACACDPTDD